MNKNDFKEMTILALVVWFLADIMGLITWGPFDMLANIIGNFLNPFIR